MKKPTLKQTAIGSAVVGGGVLAAEAMDVPVTDQILDVVGLIINLVLIFL